MKMPNPEARLKPNRHQAEQEWMGEFALAGGPVLRFRHVRPEDEPLIALSISTASRETLLHRFFSPIRKVSPDVLRKMLAIDRAREACIVGVIEESGRSRVVCGARYVRLDQPGVAEIALTVHDEFQRRGLGTYLLRLLIRLGRAEGLRQYEAYVMNSNRAMLKLLEKVVPVRATYYEAGDVNRIVFRLEQFENENELVDQQ